MDRYSSLRETFRKITGSSYIDKNVIKEMIRDIQRALLKADVNVKLMLDLDAAQEKIGKYTVILDYMTYKELGSCLL